MYDTSVLDILPFPSTTVQTTNVADPHVVVRGSGGSFLQTISAGEHFFEADEPVSFGGEGWAPDPHDYLMTALGACTSMMIGLHARKKKWPLENVAVSLRHSRVDITDCDECMCDGGKIDRIDVSIELTGPLTPQQRTDLMEVAATCPIHQALTHGIDIRVRPT